MKKFLLAIITLLLLIIAGLFTLLRYPTDVPMVSSKFADRADFSHLPKKLDVHVYITGQSPAPEAFVVEGGGIFQKHPMVFPAILIKHPKGHLLIDGGLGKNIAAEMEQAPLPWGFTPIQAGKPFVEQYKASPPVSIPAPITGLLVTHGHWDHLSGAADLPGVPIYLLPEEIEHMTRDLNNMPKAIFRHQVEPLQNRFKAIQLKPKPYENFERSLDWFGDGSVILVSLAGHTPGSLGIFINRSATERFLIVGDALFSVDANGFPEKRSLLAELLSDDDRHQARIVREKLRELVNHSNEVTLVPVHDPVPLRKLHTGDMDNF